MSDEALLDFSRAAADALRSALPLAEFLRGRGLPKAAEAVAGGEPLHLALGRTFPALFRAMVRAGEESGKLDAFLDRYSASIETRLDFHRRLGRALIYPLFAGALAVALFLLFTIKAAPLLLLPLSEAGIKLPSAALRLIGVGDWIWGNRWLLAGSAFGACVILRELWRSGPGRKLRGVASRVLPGARYITEEARSNEFEATLGLLLGAGLRPRETMEVLLQCVEDDLILRRRLARGAELLPQGKSLVECVSSCLPEEDRARFSTAEKAGRIDETLEKLAASHREKHLHRLKTAATAVQLGAVVALAPLCFALIMSVVWPALAALRSVGAEATTGLPVESAAKLTTQDAATSRFNETQASRVTGFMAEHAAPAPAASGGSDGKKKPFPHLKPMPMQRLPRGKASPTEIRSNLE